MVEEYQGQEVHSSATQDSADYGCIPFKSGSPSEKDPSAGTLEFTGGVNITESQSHSSGPPTLAPQLRGKAVRITLASLTSVLNTNKQGRKDKEMILSWA